MRHISANTEQFANTTALEATTHSEGSRPEVQRRRRAVGSKDAVGPAGVVEHGEGGPEAERAVRVGAVGRARSMRVGVHRRRQILSARCGAHQQACRTAHVGATNSKPSPAEPLG